MNVDQVVTLLVLIGALVLFVTELLPIGVTGLCIIAVLGLAGTLDPDTAVSAFSSQVVVLVGSLYVVSASLIRTGVVNVVGKRMLDLGRGSELRLLVVSTLAAALVSSLLNNTSVVVLMIPILLGAAARLGVPPSRLLMPVSFASILGGTMTLIGTSTNVLVADMAQKIDVSLGFFEFLPVGAGCAAIGLVYLWLVGRRILPKRQTVSSVTRGRPFEYVTELFVPKGSPVIGMTPAELTRRAGERIRLLQLVHGEEVLDRFSQKTVLTSGDLLVMRGLPEAIVALRRDLHLEPLPGASDPDTLAVRGTTFAEIVITPISELVGRTLASVGLHRRFGVVAVALQRRGAHLRHGIANVPLHASDVILVQGTPDEVEKLRGEPGLLLLVGVEEKAVLLKRAPVAIAILGAFVALASTRLIPIPLAGIAAAAACLLTGCLSLGRAVREVNWNVLGLLAGAITLGLALTQSGLAAKAAELLVGVTRDLGPTAVLSAVYLLTAIATEFVSNCGAAAVMLPISIATAVKMGVDPRPFVFAVAYAASASFSTPIGYQTNAFVYGPGGYRFSDYFRVGFPLQLLLWAFCSLVIPQVFPF